MFKRSIILGVLGALVAMVAPTTSSAASPERTAPSPRSEASAGDWLGEINYYRTASGLTPVTDNASWDQGIADHLNYLKQTPASFYTGQYQSLHTENPASPFYTPSGAKEAESSDIISGASPTPTDSIDSWLSAPFHAIGMLRPGLRQVAYGSDPTGAGAMLDVISGLTGASTDATPVLFPGPGAVTDLSGYGGESPDPTESCNSTWKAATGGVGLPLIALLPSAPRTGLSATLVGPGGTQSTADGLLCEVDQNDYVSSDPVYGPTGLGILESDHAVLLLPRVTLSAGTYTATINQPGSPPITWSFTEDPPLVGPVVGMAATLDGGGYWLADSHGGVSIHGDARFFGSMAGQALNAPIAHIVATHDGLGYWLVASDGGTFAFGDAGFYGSMAGAQLNAPVVDLAPTADGGGYWLVASDGGVFAFGDAAFHGSMGGESLNAPIVGISPDAATGGYWEVATDGGIFAFGAPFFGSTGALHLNRPVNGMSATSDDRGYWFVASDGGIFAFGKAGFFGSAGGAPLNQPVVGMATDSATGGYWLVAADGGVFSYNAPFRGAD